MSFWTDEKTDELRRLHAEGQSGYFIARALGTTRSAVNAKRNRVGLSAHPVERERSAAKSVAEKVRIGSFSFGAISHRPSAGPQQPSVRDLDEPWRTDGLRIMDKGFSGCRWPIGGDGAETLFCCRPAQSSYCAEHQLKARGKTITSAEASDLVRMARRVA